ncbi:MAG: hypothetical protein QOC65_554, partial [Sphingomonadales bacterium]|nr:hypothetical protein [Sphingomonadales bacterium]
MSPPPAFSQPPLAAWRTEMVMADIAYRSPLLRGGMSAAQFRSALGATDPYRINIPAAGFPYSALEISSRFRVVATTNDEGVAGSLGSDGRGGTRSGFQGVILQDVNTQEYFLTVAGVTTTSELLRTNYLVGRYGIQLSWSQDLVGLIDYAERLEHVNNMRFTQTWGHSGAQSAIYGADLFLQQTHNYGAFPEVVTFQGLGPNSGNLREWRRRTNNGANTYGYAGPLSILDDSISPAWRNVLFSLDQNYGPGADPTNVYVNVRVGGDLVSHMGDDDFGVEISYRYGTDPSLRQGLWTADPRLHLGQPNTLAPVNDHLMTTVWRAADIPENNVAAPGSAWIAPSWFQRVSLEFSLPEIRLPEPELLLPFWDADRVVGFQRYLRDAHGELQLNESFRFTLLRDANGVVVLSNGDPLITGDESFRNGLTVVRTYLDPIQDSSQQPTITDTDILIPGNPFGVTFSDVGGVLGAQLGYLIAGRNQFLGAALAGTLETVGDSLGDFLDGLIGGGARKASASVAFARFGQSLGANIAGAGVGAVSTLIAAELVRATGLTGFPADLFNSAAGSAFNTVLSNVAGLNGSIFASAPFSNVASAATLGAAVGSFLGAKLAAQFVTFDTVGGQLGSAVGTALGVIAAGKLLSIGGVLGGPLGAAIGAFAGYILGGLVGSVFGGTPRSGADVHWDPATHEFAVANVYSRKGGSKDVARSMATTVAETLNGVVTASGGILLHPESVQTGNYGMIKSDFVYRLTANSSHDSVLKRFSGDSGGERLIEYGIAAALRDSDFKIAGGDVYVKRAIYNTLLIAGENGSLDTATMLGNIESAKQYRTFNDNQLVINQIVSGDRHGVFALETALTIARAVELGLTRRNESDWFGGFSFLLDEAGTNAASVAFGFDYDQLSDRIRRGIGVAVYLLPDEIDVAGQTRIEGGISDDVIKFSEFELLLTSSDVNVGLTVNGIVHDGSAVEIAVAATIDAGAGDDFVQASDRGDNVFGGAGDDTLYGGRLDDWLLGGEGNDILHAGSQAGGLGGDGKYLDGGAGDDQVFGGEGSDWLEGGEGVDLLDGGGGDDILTGGGDGVLADGNAAGDTLKGGHGGDQYLLRIGDGADLADESAAGAVWSNGAAAGTDRVKARFAGIAAGTVARNWRGDDFDRVVAEAVSTSAAPVVAAAGAGGEDAIVFGLGIGIGDIRLTRLGGANGADLLVEVIQEDADGAPALAASLTVRDWFADPFKRIEWLKFADGTEIRIGDFTSFVAGTAGGDVIIGTEGNDFVYAGDGDDEIRLLAGNDVGIGAGGDDLVSGDDGRDMVIGGTGADRLIGGRGEDTLSGDAGDDDLHAGADDDILSGGRGDDQMVGGAGDDVFKYARGDGRDT